MSIQPVKIRAVDALLPTTLIDLAKTNEKEMRVTATLVLNLFTQLIRLVRDNKIQPLDAFPGDRYCQGRVRCSLSHGLQTTDDHTAASTG